MRSLAVSVVLFAAAACPACKDKPAAPANAPAATTPGKPPTLNGPAITEEDARAFADDVASSAVPCDATALGGLLAVDNTAVAARLVCEWLKDVSSYKLVSVRSVGGTPHPILRRLLTHEDSGAMFVNYDELALTRAADGTLRIADVFSFRQGVWISELIEANSATVAGSTDFLGPSSTHPEVRAARDQLRDGDRAGALAAIDALPPAIRTERGVQMLRVRAASKQGADAYKAALDELAKTFPDDPAIALIELDGALDRGDGTAAGHWIDVLEKAIGVEAYLESQRVVALVRMGDLDRALTAANAAVELEPTLTRALEIKLDVLIAKKQWTDVLATMQELESKHGTSFDVAKLRAEPHLAELVKLPAFQDWAAHHAP